MPVQLVEVDIRACYHGHAGQAGLGQANLGQHRLDPSHGAGGAGLLAVAESQDSGKRRPRRGQARAQPGPRRGRGRRVLVRRQEDGELEAAAELTRLAGGRMQIRGHRIRRQVHIGPQVRRPDGSQDRTRTIGPVGIHIRAAQAYRRERRAVGPVDRNWADRNSQAGLARATSGGLRKAISADHDFLVELLAKRGLVVVTEAGRCRRRLVGGVGPVALILHFPEIAGEPEPDDAAGRVRQVELTDGLEQRQVGAVLKVYLRADRVGQGAADLAVGRGAPVPLRGVAVGRVVHAGADLGVSEGGQRRAAHPVADRPGRVPVDLGAPLVVQVAGLVPPGEPDREAVAAVGEVEVGDVTRQRVPVQIPDRHIDPAGNLDVAITDLAEVAAGEQHPDRPGAQDDGGRPGHARSGPDGLYGQVTHDAAPARRRPGSLHR